MVPGEACSHHENAHSTDEGSDVAHVGEAVPWGRGKTWFNMNPTLMIKLDTLRIQLHVGRDPTFALMVEWKWISTLTNTCIFNLKGLNILTKLILFHISTWLLRSSLVWNLDKSQVFTAFFKNTFGFVSLMLCWSFCRVAMKKKPNCLRSQRQQLDGDVWVPVPFTTSQVHVKFAYGCPASGLRTDWLIPRASRAWLQVSAREWMASENILADPV